MKESTVKLIYITGASGSGKSKLLQQAQRVSRIAYFDCLLSREQGCVWEDPDSNAVDAVAIDHVHWRNGSNVVIDALAWCEVHGKTLCLAENDRIDLNVAFVRVPDGVVELNLSSATASLVAGLSAVPVGSWYAAILRASQAASHSVPEAELRKVAVEQTPPKRPDGRSREAREARRVARSHSA